MKWLLALVLVGGVAYAVAFVPPRTAARVTARALRTGWDWVASIGALKEEPTRRGGQKTSRKAQAATPQRRANRDGILPQPPKETLQRNDRDALDALVAKSR